MSPARSAVLEVRGLSLGLTRRSRAPLVHEVTFAVKAGETLGVVGESGSGKSLTMLAVMGLLPPAVGVTAGSIHLDGRELLGLAERERRLVRGVGVSIVFQDPMTSLNPVLTVGTQVREALRRLKLSRAESAARAVELLRRVGMNDPAGCMGRYPYELSGGMRQRVMIAMALACRPRVLVADEPTTALDVTTQAQIIDLIGELQQAEGFAVIWVSHDLGVIAGVADQILVMYAGHAVESGPADRMFHSPAHPYTRGLLGSIARLDEAMPDRLPTIPGRPPSLGITRLPGCQFAPRCPEAEPACGKSAPPAVPVGPDHLAVCIHAPGPQDSRTEAGQ